MALKQFKLIFTVNNRRTEQVVSANSITDAQKLIQAQYAGQKISSVNVKQV